MSQVGQIVSCSYRTFKGDNPNFLQDWSVCFTYQLDSGGTQQAEIIVGPDGISGWA